MTVISQDDREKARQEAIDAVPFEPGQWAWGTRAVAWPDDRNGTRVLLEWTGRTWHGVEVSNAWAPTQIIDVIPVDRPADPGGAPVTENTDLWEYSTGYEGDNGIEVRWFSLDAAFTVREAAENDLKKYDADPQVRLIRRRAPGSWEPVEELD